MVRANRPELELSISSHDQERRNLHGRRGRIRPSAGPMVQAALPRSDPWPAREAAANRAGEARRQARQICRPGASRAGRPRTAAEARLGAGATEKFGARPLLVHRLDRDTSGVLVLARGPKAAKSLTEAFRGKAARKL